MQDSKSSSQPFKLLGTKLKYLREHRQESLAEVSGAVEIEPEVLARIEKGEERPSEEILMLLINHFGMPDHEAMYLWESAGYEGDIDDRFRTFSEPHNKTLVVLALDLRVLYSDGLSITSNSNGVVLNFLQQANQPQPLPVARVGMSYEQVAEVLRALQLTLLRHKYSPQNRHLPPGSSN